MRKTPLSIRLLQYTLLGLLTVACRLQAAPPVPFEAVYDARYDSYRAEASRSLRLDPDSGHYLLQSQARLRLLGATLTSIEERSEFRWQNDQLLPLQYSFRQRGLGARRRGASFNHAAGLASWQVDEREGELAFTGQVYDELNGYLGLTAGLRAGEREITLQVLDRDELEQQLYRVIGEENLQTRIGAFDTVVVERVREGDNPRRTRLWLAPARDYLLVKLQQTEPNGRSILLELRELQTPTANAE